MKKYKLELKENFLTQKAYLSTVCKYQTLYNLVKPLSLYLRLETGRLYLLLPT